MVPEEDDDFSKDFLISNKIIAELQLKELQLNALLEITQSINKNAKIEDLLQIYEHFLQYQLKVGKLALFTRESNSKNEDQNWNCVLFYGANPELKNMDVSILLKDIKYPQPIPQSDTLLNEFSTILPVLHKEQALAYALIGDYQNTDLDYHDDVLPFIQLITNIILVAHENKRFAREQIKQAGVKKEMELAAKMQSMLFPVKFPINSPIEIFGTYLPHQEVGGDYYDYFMLNENEIIICIADVSGKGVSAALLMSNFQANLHALVKHFTTLHVLITDLNSCVMDSAHGEKHITFFSGLINTHTNVLTYVNAGHPPPMLYSKGSVQMLKTGTTGLGMFEELPFMNIGYAKISEDSTMLCYTDGVLDTENESEEHFGIERVEQFLMENYKAKTITDLHKRLIDTLRDFNASTQLPDDISLLTCRYKHLQKV